MNEGKRSWKLADIGTFLKNSFVAILKGEFLLRLNVGRYFVHIVYTFFLFAMVIWISLMIDSTLSKVENNNKTIQELEIIHSQKTYEIVSLSRRSSVNELLQQMGSDVTEPQQPAVQLSK